MIAITTLYSCVNDKDEGIGKDDFRLIKTEYHKKFEKLPLSGDNNTNRIFSKTILNKVQELMFTFEQTRFGDAAFLETDAVKIKQLSENISDKSTLSYLQAVLLFLEKSLGLVSWQVYINSGR